MSNLQLESSFLSQEESRSKLQFILCSVFNDFNRCGCCTIPIGTLITSYVFLIIDFVFWMHVHNLYYKVQHIYIKLPCEKYMHRMFVMCFDISGVSKHNQKC